MFTAALSTIAKSWKEPSCPSTDDSMKKQWTIYNGILLSHQKERLPNICSNMDGTGGDYAKRNKSSRERQLSYGFTHLWNIRNRKIDKRRKGRIMGV